jgi:hypothetical protein
MAKRLIIPLSPIPAHTNSDDHDGDEHSSEATTTKKRRGIGVKYKPRKDNRFIAPSQYEEHGIE